MHELKLKPQQIDHARPGLLAWIYGSDCPLASTASAAPLAGSTWEPLPARHHHSQHQHHHHQHLQEHHHQHLHLGTMRPPLCAALLLA